MSMLSAAADPIDLHVLPELTECDDEMRDIFLADFLPVLATDQQALALAASQHDLTALAAVAHRIKSAARYVGATTLGELSDGLELAGQAADTTACTGLLAQWQQECRRVQVFLAAHLGLPQTD